jgi:hypothetical protein
MPTGGVVTGGVSTGGASTGGVVTGGTSTGGVLKIPAETVAVAAVIAMSRKAIIIAFLFMFFTVVKKAKVEINCFFPIWKYIGLHKHERR